MKNIIITNEMYLEAIENAFKTEGYEVASIMNKLALEKKAISLDQFRAAAQLIIDLILG